jgi:hypothetical protein
MLLRFTTSLIIGISILGLGSFWIYQYLHYGYIMLKEGTKIYDNQALICTSSATIIGFVLIISELRRQKKDRGRNIP